METSSTKTTWNYLVPCFQQQAHKLSFKSIPICFLKNKKQEDISFPDLLDNSWVGDLLMKYTWLSFSS